MLSSIINMLISKEKKYFTRHMDQNIYLTKNECFSYIRLVILHAYIYEN